MMNIINIFMLFGLMLALSAQAASFDCNKARTPIERSICNNPELSKLDEELASAYKRSLETFPVKGFIRAWQREWLSEIRSTSCKSDCSSELIPLYRNRVERLMVDDKSLIFSDALEFSTENSNAVVIIYPVKNGAVISVWGGFVIHRQASIDAGKSVYMGCNFNGRMNSIYANRAVDGNDEIGFAIKGDKLSWTEEPRICAGFGRLPDELLRVYLKYE